MYIVVAVTLAPIHGNDAPPTAWKIPDPACTVAPAMTLVPVSSCPDIEKAAIPDRLPASVRIAVLFCTSLPVARSQRTSALSVALAGPVTLVASAAACAVLTGLLTSLVLSTFASPTVVLVIAPQALLMRP